MGKYDDIINLPHRVSPSRKKMSNHDRAAQFAPYAALAGYGDAINEAARSTDDRAELCDDARAETERRLQNIFDVIDDDPTVYIKYFIPDAKKAGGRYAEIFGRVARIDEITRTIYMKSGEVIPSDDVYTAGIVDLGT